MRSRRSRIAARLVALTVGAGVLLGTAVPGHALPDGTRRKSSSRTRTPAEIAVAAARSAIGTDYVFGGASRAGFDCSGLTMWAWARAGVALPHSAREQRRSIPRVSRSRLQRGDLVFFYRPVRHVGVYVGRRRMIAANRPGGSVRRQRVFWAQYSGGGRPSSE